MGSFDFQFIVCQFSWNEISCFLLARKYSYTFQMSVDIWEEIQIKILARFVIKCRFINNENRVSIANFEWHFISIHSAWIKRHYNEVTKLKLNVIILVKNVAISYCDHGHCSIFDVTNRILPLALFSNVIVSPANFKSTRDQIVAKKLYSFILYL